MKSITAIFRLLTITLPLAVAGQQLENPGFEEWETAAPSIIEPVEWNSIKTADDPGIAAMAPITIDRSEDAHTGNYSLKLYNVTPFPNLVATGAITNGRFHAEFDLTKSYSYTQRSDPKYHTSFTWRPDSLTGWFKYFPNLNDAAQFKVILHVDSCKLPTDSLSQLNIVGMGVFVTEHGVTYDSWTRFSVPFQYFNDSLPEYALTTMNSGDSITAIDGSYLLIDDLELKYAPAGINEPKKPDSFLTYGKGILNLTLAPETYMNQWFYIIDASGQTVYSTRLERGTINLPESIPGAVYIALLITSDRQYAQKILIP